MSAFQKYFGIYPSDLSSIRMEESKLREFIVNPQIGNMSKVGLNKEGIDKVIEYLKNQWRE